MFDAGRLVAADHHALLVVARGGVVGVDDGVGGEAERGLLLGPLVDGVHVRNLLHLDELADSGNTAQRADEQSQFLSVARDMRC
eukprot:CAMPEP_0180280084 /NCGR_PEP_ID=MMETSP0988-20121125/8435_1 /TAXON_ID=697907 /ORGANISM="non described non described, Strain CCMP2293" /LENGTH=83 /DNA_ID=CAMNT_0022251889 /DNA_START=123 /DNA_END=372 /DNA_ORIENTATION=-